MNLNHREEIISNFNISEEALAPYIVLIWSYEGGPYEGDAFILMIERATGELYEVNGGHCSCYGLEDQFEPEATSVKELQFRLDGNTNFGNDNYTGHSFRNRLIDLMSVLDLTEKELMLWLKLN